MAYFYLLTFIFCSWIMGCAPGPYLKPALPPSVPGIYHRVERGETLWRISKIYTVDLDEIVRINRIANASTIDVGQLIFIPHRQKPQVLAGRSPAEDFIWPVRGRVISTFGQTFNNMINRGLNIQAHHNSDIVASRSGRVVFSADNFNGFGKTVIIDHGDGFSTVYARNSRVFIKPGGYVQRGITIARAGSAGRDENVYLHFEIRKGHLPQNPYFYLP